MFSVSNLVLFATSFRNEKIYINVLYLSSAISIVIQWLYAVN